MTTLEGITPTQGLHPLQQAFYENFAIQCGYCTPGMIMVSRRCSITTRIRLARRSSRLLSGNHCRCTGYEPIIRAVQDAAERMNGQARRLKR